MESGLVVAVGAVAAGAIVLAGCSSSANSVATGSSPATSPGSTSSPAPASSNSSTTPALAGSITVFAASSLTETFTQLGQSFEAANPGTTVKFSFGSSGALATQIDQGAPADVFASAAPSNMATVIKAGNASTSSNFVKNTGEIATPPGNPKAITSVADLGQSGVKVAVCVITAPCGKLALQIFANAKVVVKPTTSQPDVKSTLAIVESKEVDAGLVYVTDVRSAGSKVTGVVIPASVNATTEYPIAALTHAKNAALASAFVTDIESPASLQVFTAAGFLTP